MHNFGVERPDLDRHRHRHTVFGLVVDGPKIGCVGVRDTDRCYFDLPGGGVQAGETEAKALIREFKEETGLLIEPKVRLTEAGQYFTRSDGETRVYNYGGFWTVKLIGETERREADHRLCWLTPVEAIGELRQESHAWFVSRWLRWNQRSQEHYPRPSVEQHWHQASLLLESRKKVAV